MTKFGDKTVLHVHVQVTSSFSQPLYYCRARRISIICTMDNAEYGDTFQGRFCMQTQINTFRSRPIKNVHQKGQPRFSQNEPPHGKTINLHVRKQRRRSAKLISAFVFATRIDSTLPLLFKSEISSFQPASMTVQPDLCRTCSESTLLVFPRGGSDIGKF